MGTSCWKFTQEKIVDIDKALQLYEHGNLIEKAAELAFDHNLFSKALEYYRSINDVSGEAKHCLPWAIQKAHRNCTLLLEITPEPLN